MKKVFLLACLLFSTLLSFAQTKKVAILEVVDREGRLSYSQKLVLRSNMARAVTNTLGYEAYDRTDVDMIMSEHDFQRTGLVKDEDIRRLGEMTGVSLILVTEGVLTDYNNIFVTAKILNVETGKVEMMDNMMMSLSSNGMQQGCTDLARKLFGTSAVVSQPYKYNVTRLSANKYSYQGETLDKNTYREFLRTTCPNAYSVFNTGRIMNNGGWACVGCGLGFLAAGCILVSLPGYTLYRDASGNWVEGPSPIRAPGIALVTIGAITVCASTPLFVIGHRKQKESVDIYNKQCASPANRLTFNLTSGTNGLGIAMNF